MVFRSFNIAFFFYQIRESVKLKEDKSSTGVSSTPRSSVRVKNPYDDSRKCMLLLSYLVPPKGSFWGIMTTLKRRSLQGRLESKRKMG